MIDFSQIAENFQDFFSERKKAFLICAILVLFFFVALIVMAVAPSSKKSDASSYVPAPFVADQELLLPQDSSVPQGYSLSRRKGERWSESEVERHFTRPDDAAIERLSSANDAMIFEMLGAAP